jgi:S-adenosyl-L-methionine hydrolase (adenosine-forming)
VCHLVIARIAPDVRVIDLAHGIRTVRAGGAVLAQSVPFAPSGSVHLAVVDSGVGTSRRGIVIETADGSRLVGPDNGLLIAAADVLGGVVEAFEITRYHLEPVSQTFHGRDVFAPAAAHVALGVSPDEFGPPVDALVRLPAPFVEISPDRIASDVLRSDHFGNLQLAVTELPFEGAVEIVCDAGTFDAIVGRTFADGDLVVMIDSGGHVAIARNGGSARDLLQDPERLTIRGKS